MGRRCVEFFNILEASMQRNHAGIALCLCDYATRTEIVCPTRGDLSPSGASSRGLRLLGTSQGEAGVLEPRGVGTVDGSRACSRFHWSVARHQHHAGMSSNWKSSSASGVPVCFLACLGLQRGFSGAAIVKPCAMTLTATTWSCEVSKMMDHVRSILG